MIRARADGRYMKYHIDNVDASQGPNYEKAKKFGQMLLDNCESHSYPDISERGEQQQGQVGALVLRKGPWGRMNARILARPEAKSTR
jgi:hypothetical protein